MTHDLAARQDKRPVGWVVIKSRISAGSLFQTVDKE
jgi:hypothetical protein